MPGWKVVMTSSELRASSQSGSKIRQSARRVLPRKSVINVIRAQVLRLERAASRSHQCPGRVKLVPQTTNSLSGIRVQILSPAISSHQSEMEFGAVTRNSAKGCAARYRSPGCRVLPVFNRHLFAVFILNYNAAS